MKYKGQITLHTEMCCGAWPQFHDDRGLHGDEKQYWNWDWTINFGRDTEIKNLKIWDKDDNLVYDDSWTFCRRSTASNKYYIPCPYEMPPEEWLSIIGHEHLRCEVETDEVLPMTIEERVKNNNEEESNNRRS